MLSTIQKKIKKTEAYLIKDNANLFYITGYESISSNLLLLKNKAFYLTNALYFQEAVKQLPKEITPINTQDPLNAIKDILNKHKIKVLFFEDDTLTYRQHTKICEVIKNTNIEPQSNFIKNFREQKKENEIAMITKALQLAEKTMLQIVKKIYSGVTEQEIAWEIIKTGRKLGASDISFEPIVAFGSNTSVPHHHNSTRKLKKGMPILIDMGLKYKGYCSDITRMFFTKNPSLKEEEIYNTVLDAQFKAIKRLKTGISCAKIDAVARSVISDRGYGKNFNHALGHGIGLEVHESPSISQKNSSLLKLNSIVTVEPGIYIENHFGVRIEDMVQINTNGAKNLTSLPKKLDDVVIKIT
jgi:Xaa-Pro aminopeptidase